MATAETAAAAAAADGEGKPQGEQRPPKHKGKVIRLEK
jgi:hypothetical protein